MQEQNKDLSCKNVQVLLDTLTRPLLWGVEFNKQSNCHKEAVEIHELLKKTDDVDEKLSLGHKRQGIK